MRVRRFTVSLAAGPAYGMVPAGYRPILSPEYPWGYFDEGRDVASR